MAWEGKPAPKPVKYIVGSGADGAPAYASGMSDLNTGAGYRCWIQKSGQEVTVVVMVTKGATATAIFQLPAGWEPPVPVPIALASSGTPVANQGAIIGTNGVVAFAASGLTNTGYYGSVTYQRG